MAHEILFDPSEYRELSVDDQAFLRLAYQKALEALRRNITPNGFTACSLADNTVYGTDANYRAVWARDGAKTVVWTLDLPDQDVRECQEATLRTILDHQSSVGQLPGLVNIDDGTPEYGGVGGIATMDSGLWTIIAIWRRARRTGDWSLVEAYAAQLHKAMAWLRAHDSNNCGMLEIPEAGDWTDLFARSYHVLYDEVLWQRCLFAYSDILRHLGDVERADEYERLSARVKQLILRRFWPSTSGEDSEGIPSFSDVQFALGDTRYLVAQISPFDFSWRCDVYGNLLAYIMDLVDKPRAMMTFRFLWGVGVNDPWPAKNHYPPVRPGDREWRDYFTVNLLNLPHHYHNGGIWPFIGGLWVRYVHKLGMRDLARRELVKLAQACSLGVAEEWEFNEWHHGETGRPMGKAFQAWSAASFLKACHYLQIAPDSADAAGA